MSETLEKLKKAILECNTEEAANFAAKAVQEDIDPLKLADATTEAIREIGNAYGREELWLPDLIGGANAAEAAMSVIETELEKRRIERKPLATIVIGTVYGDIHDIGKTMVAALARAEGFEVIDLGVNVKGETFMEAIRKHEPEILAMSALLTTTAAEQAKCIKILKGEGLREKVKVVVGGGAITTDFAESIGADGYESTAPKAAALFKRLVGEVINE